MLRKHFLIILLTIFYISCSDDPTSSDYVRETSTVTDIDGNVYNTVKIGNQWWMAENLKVTHYRNGDTILNVTEDRIWGILAPGAFCNYDNNAANVAFYGRLYNWYAVNDSPKIAPAGFHVPTDGEFKQLETYLGMSQESADSVGRRGHSEGGNMKEIGFDHWYSPNTGATNESGFAALPGGRRANNGNFGNIGGYGYWWSATEINIGFAWFRGLSYDSTKVFRYGYGKHCGLSVRCVKD
jgi:uncharacterized protein (TIGR02145 family)